jgi:hypothetical protein
MREVYDVFTKEIISFEGRVKEMAQKLGFKDHTGFSHLWAKKWDSVGSRYIRPEDKDKIFTLIDYDTGKEYDCITNKSIFVHLNLPVVDNEIKYIYELFRNRQKVASICGKVFSLKGKNTRASCPGHVKNFSTKIQEELKEKKLKRKIKDSIMSRIASALKAKNLKKNNRTEYIIGCSIEFLKGYLASKFTNNMSWDNYGEWHIDHIIPCNLFELKNEREQLKCFHYTNLRPLWATTKIAEKYGEHEYIGNLNREYTNPDNKLLTIENWINI